MQEYFIHFSLMFSPTSILFSLYLFILSCLALSSDTRSLNMRFCSIMLLRLSFTLACFSRRSTRRSLISFCSSTISFLSYVTSLSFCARYISYLSIYICRSVLYISETTFWHSASAFCSVIFSLYIEPCLLTSSCYILCLSVSRSCSRFCCCLFRLPNSFIFGCR